MGDVSAFMKTVKQRFSVWYNQSHARYGTLWADRFKSVLVEGDTRALATVAAYIDLNPVRAGMVEDPGKYPERNLGDGWREIPHPDLRRGGGRIHRSSKDRP